MYYVCYEELIPSICMLYIHPLLKIKVPIDTFYVNIAKANVTSYYSLSASRQEKSASILPCNISCVLN